MSYSRGEPITLLASAARTTVETNYGTAFRIADLGVPIQSLIFELDLTAAAADSDDTLDVWIQTSLDRTNYVDVVRFTQCLGNGSAKRYLAKVSAAGAETMFEVATALGAAAVRNLIGELIRVKWTLAKGTDADQSFTFSVTAVAL